MVKTCMVIIASFATIQLHAQVARPKLIPLIAEYENESSRVLPDGNSIKNSQSGRYYRDSMGRTRLEAGRLIIITDNKAGATYVLDPALKTVRKMDHAAIRAVSTGNSSTRIEATLTPSGTAEGEVLFTKRGVAEGNSARLTVNKSSLGDKIVEGITCEAQRNTSTIPEGRIGNARPLEMSSEICFSKELQLPLMSVTDNPLGGRSVQRYKNITTGVEPDPSLFKVPDGYKSID